MLNININERKKLKFGFMIAGVQVQDIKGALRLEANGIEYGFPIKIVNDKIEVEIPVLQNLITEIQDSYNLKLELIANDTYMVPWSDVAKIKVPVSIKISENIEEETEPKQKIKIDVTKIEEKTEKTPKLAKRKSKFTDFLIK